MSASVTADHFGVREDVALHGAFYVGFRGAGFQIQFCVERIQLEEIAVRIPGRRARSAMPDFAEVVAALPRAIRELVLLWNTFRELSGICRQIEQHPMYPGACGSVRIVHDERKALCLSRRLGPTKRRRGVWSVAGKFLRNGFSGRKGRAGDFHGSSLGSREGSCAKERRE